jgi:hypothetical protein
MKNVPSPVIGQFYRRKGGAWAKTKTGFKKVGYGNGLYSKHDPIADRKRKATIAPRGTVKKYPQQYDEAPRKRRR